MVSIHHNTHLPSFIHNSVQVSNHSVKVWNSPNYNKNLTFKGSDNITIISFECN